MKLILAYLTYSLVQLKISAKLSAFIGFFITLGYKFFSIISYNLNGFLEIEKQQTTVERAIYWFTTNQDYILIVLGAIAIDHFFGTWKHIKLKNFNIKHNIEGLFIKLSVVIAGGLLFEGLGHLITRDSIIKTYLIIVGRILVFLFPARSSWRSMSVVTNGKFPPKSWIEKMDKFERNLDIDNLKPKEKDENEGQELH